MKQTGKKSYRRLPVVIAVWEKGLAANSIDSYAHDLDRLEKWADKNSLGLKTLSRQDLREWLIDLGAEKLSENSKRRIISAARGFYKFFDV